MALTDLPTFERSNSLYEDVSDDQFFDHKWQDRNSVTRIDQLEALVEGKASESSIADMRAGLSKVGMSIRLNPYILEMIDWSDAKSDPIRRQFLPMESELLEDHPFTTVDSLDEQHTSPVPNIVHRYPDKVLFLATSVCPVYCQYCTRSYAVGQDTESLSKENVTSPAGWQTALEYIRSNPTIEDVVISGGDVARLKAAHIKLLGHALLDIEHVRRIRFATKSVSVQPMKFLTDDPWFDAIVEVADRGREMFKSVFVHTHFNHPREVTSTVELAMRRLFAHGIYVRNQAVLLRGVNDDAATMVELIKKLGRCNIQPYYVYSCDMVLGTEHYRVTVEEMQQLEREVRGATAGFNTPLFIVDLPGGGGKRDVHSYEFRSERYGITGYRSPNVDADRMFLYFDPIHTLEQDAQEEWTAPGGARRILQKLGLLDQGMLAA